MDDDQWKQKLTPEQYRVLRQKGTEAPFSGELFNEKGTGDFVCVGCGTVVFTSDTKYDSNVPGLAGWPSFSDVAHSDSVELLPDNTLGMSRTEVTCKTCGGHLGHLFDDDSSPSGQHYCINSVCLGFKPEKKPAI